MRTPEAHPQTLPQIILDLDATDAFVHVGGTLVPETCKKRRKKKCPTSLLVH